MNAITMEDTNYLAQQLSEKINMILSGMTALMHDTERKSESDGVPVSKLKYLS